MKKATSYGIIAALFFAVTFLLNRSMNLSGGSYLWSASLRYIFMLPILWGILRYKKDTKNVYDSIRANKMQWIVWSTVGFGLFYLPLSFASAYGASWLVAGTWQITIIAGAILTPLWGKKIPVKTVGFSSIVLVGVILLQLENATSLSASQSILCVLPVMIAAFAYPLGNRKMMDVCGEELSTMQRVFGMTLCSMPFWIMVSAVATYQVGLPGTSQLVQSLFVAVFSGVVATVLFFKATELVKNNEKHLAAVEATQAGEVLFTLLGSILFLSDSVPGMVGIIGLVCIVAGMILNSIQQ